MLLTAVRAEGVTELRNAAVEPEIIDLICVLQKMGAIINLDTDRTIRVTGVERLGGYVHEALPDRIEAGSWACAALATGGEVFVRNARQVDLMTFLNVYRRVGGAFEVTADGIRFWHPGGKLDALALETDVHPGFMTDWQQPLVVALTQATGLSIVHETVYENRLGYTDALVRLGAHIQVYSECLGATPCRFGRRNFSHSAVISGPSSLHGADLMVPDLRGGFSYLIAALAAQGRSTVRGVGIIAARVRELPRQAREPRRPDRRRPHLSTTPGLGLDLREAVGLPDDVGTEPGQHAHEVGVAPVEVVDTRHERLAVGDQSRRGPARRRPGCRSPRPGHPTASACPRTTAWWPSVRTSAPSRASSWTNRNRPSKRFSVTIDVPSLIAASVTIIACRSVGNPGYGSVTTSIARGRRSIRTVNASGPTSIDAPASASFSSTISRWPARPFRTVTMPPATAVPMAQVPATIRSGTTWCSTACSVAGPSISSVDVPMPPIFAPIRVSISAMSTISGSRATLSIIVVPFARVAARRRFSVAPTLGKSRKMVLAVQAVGGLRDDVPVLDPDVGAHLREAGDVHAEPAGPDAVAAG